MKASRILELSGNTFGDKEGDLDYPDGGIGVYSENKMWKYSKHQKVGPLEWNGIDEEPVYLDITIELLVEWAKEHNCDPNKIRAILIDPYTQLIVCED